MNVSRFTLIGLYDYMDRGNENLFDKMEMPDEIDKEVLIQTLLTKAGDFEPIYISPVFLREHIGIWSRKWIRTFERWVELIKAEYNPIENYDRYEDITEQRDIASNSGQQSSTESADARSAFDSAGYEPYQKNNSSGNSSSNTSTDDDLVRTAHIHGNIGVMTAASMITSEIELARFNLYEQISDIFINEFMIQVY